MRQVVHVLSPGLSSRGDIVDFVGNNYVGGFTRMLAAVQIAQTHPDFEICMVGGGDATPETFSPLSAKTQQMANFVCRRGIDVEQVTELTSLPCTFHNMVAILLSGLEDRIHGISPPLRILTNGYHIQRGELLARAAWSDVTYSFGSPKITWLHAEEIMGISEDDLGTAAPEAYRARLDLEAQGMTDLGAGTYTDSCATRYGTGIINAFNNRVAEYTRLVSPSEAHNFGVPVNMADYIPRR